MESLSKYLMSALYNESVGEMRVQAAVVSITIPSIQSMQMVAVVGNGKRSVELMTMKKPSILVWVLTMNKRLLLQIGTVPKESFIQLMETEPSIQLLQIS